MIRYRISTVFFALSMIAYAHVATAAEAAKGPRMILNAEIIERLQSAAQSDEETAKRLEKLRKKADEILKKPLLSAQYEPTYSGEPPVMLFTARDMMKRATELGLVWNLWGDDRYAKRGRDELLGVAGLKDWYPQQFLATAEMSAAVAIGLDWFAAYLGDADKERILQALVEKGIEPGLELYESENPDGRSAWIDPQPRDDRMPAETERADHEWPIGTFNWNIVNNSGMALAALAVRDYKPELSERLLGHSVKSIAHGFAEYGEDGGFPEGPDYWSYATRYAVTFLSATKDILGHDFGYSQTPGFERTGDFILHLTGPTGLVFNFGDSEPIPNRAALAWLGERYHRPVDAWFDHQLSPGSRIALDLVWRASDEGENPTLAEAHEEHLFESTGVATFRSAWQKPDALFAGLKGGDSGGHHTHLDLGTFVLEGMGVRWAVELGPDNYNLPGYFGDKRWTYYRAATAGQNTLMFDGQNQVPGAIAPLTVFRQTPKASLAVVDIGRAYGVPAQSVRRGLALLNDRSFLIQDEIGADKPDAVTWGMHTHAKVELDDTDPSTMLLSQHGRTLGARIVSPPGARFETVTAYQPPPQNPNKGVTKIVINMPETSPGGRRQIAVLMQPGAIKPPDAIDIVPLENWVTAWQTEDEAAGVSETVE